MSWAWWPHTTDSRVASYRLRCQQIVEALRTAGQDAKLFNAEALAPSVLVLSKRYDRSSVQQALTLRARNGTKVVLDLCDNHFYFTHDPDGRLADRADALREACSSCDLVITASHALADVVRQEMPGSRVTVVPDAAEPPSDTPWTSRLRHPGATWQLARLERALSRIPLSQRIVWFGSHGSPGVDAGLQDLAMVRSRLEAAAKEAPLSMTVISNNRAAFETVTSGWSIPTFYLSWNAVTFSRALQHHSVAAIPIGSNPFTRCKTANRVLTAALHGLNVVADSIPSYEPMRNTIVLNDWAYGLGPYLHDKQRRQGDLVRLRQRVETMYSLPQIAACWREALQSLTEARGAGITSTQYQTTPDSSSPHSATRSASR